MELPHLAGVVSNFKGGVAVGGLSRHTILCGPSGSGKSAVVGSVEWAVSGAVSGVGCRARVVSADRLVGRLWPEAPMVDLVWSDGRDHSAVLAYHEAAEAFGAGVDSGAAWLCGETLVRAGAIHPSTVELDSAREVLGRWFALSGEDPAFFKWYAEQRERSGELEERAASARAALCRALRARANRLVIPRLCREASKFVPSSMGEVQIEISDQLRLGLKRPRQGVRWALSGAEEVVALTAVAVAKARRLRAGAVLVGAVPSIHVQLVLPPAVDMDRGVLVSWMERLRCVSWCSFVLQTTCDVLDPDEAGWHVVQL